ncbi:MAG: histidine--tRNA ligase [Oscillospiraceae bacterium]|nr:histidine--tRNA ligase [Oscillospiraceae bacterium]
MALLTQAPRGTQDILPNASFKWQHIEKTALDVAKRFGFSEIRVPTFEHTELFLRSVGDTTDVVQKEMYTFLDKGERSITLRPEGTAGVARAVVQNGLLGDALPLKVCYLANCFRYEKPQAGRLREFHQFGIEMFGAEKPSADAEVISLAHTFLTELGIKNLSLEINSIGCPECRPKYHKALREYFEKHKDKLCKTCLERLEKNPLRILDCKNDECAKLCQDAPKGIEHLCDDCHTHFEGVKSLLSAIGIPFIVNPFIVRGLDYYTKTVFEFVSTEIGAKATVCGGGRYDGLIGEIGGKDTCGIGFAVGLERLLLVLESAGVEIPSSSKPDIYIANIGDSALSCAFTLTQNLRAKGKNAICDVMGRSLNAQMKYANKIGAKYSAVIGDDEVATSTLSLKNMQTGETVKISFDEILDNI